MEKYRKAKCLMKELLKIIKEEGNGEIDYQIREVERGVSLLDYLIIKGNDKSIELELNSMIRNLYPARGGLSDFYIWRDDEDERIKVNKALSGIADELWKILS